MAHIKMLRVLASLTIFSSALCKNHLLVDQLRMDFLDFEIEQWKFVLWEAPALNQIDAKFHLIQKFNDYDQEVFKQMPEDTFRDMYPIRQINASNFLYSELEHTQTMYEKFENFLKSQVKLNRFNGADKKSLEATIEIEDMVRDILNPKTGANVTMHNVYDLIIGKENMAMKILELLKKDYQCKGYSQSPQQIYYNLYNVVGLSGLKNYVMAQFAYLISRISEKGNYTDLSDTVTINFQKRVNETMSVFRTTMELVSAAIWKCDPDNHKKGETYEEFTRLIQGHIQNEVDMNSGSPGGGTCRLGCPAYRNTTSHGCYDKDSKYCREIERCNGQIMNCKFIEKHMKICPSNTTTRKTSRRYDYIQYKHGTTMGKITQCLTIPVNSWFRFPVYCYYCMCLCDEHGPKSDRYINIRPVLADIKNNRVVTGLKFVKHNRIMHLQIEEGKLLPYGYIDNSTVRWVPVDDYNINDTGTYNGQDYHTMTYNSRELALDDIEVNTENSVVTGVRFQFIDGKLRFQIHESSFDWVTGIVSKKDEENYVYNNITEGKKKVDLNNADLPNKAPFSKINCNNNLYVEFTHTDFDADAAQTTIPFVDIQSVTSDPTVPLRGAGIYYKGQVGYGGFIAPKILTYDFSKLILERPLKIADYPNLQEFADRDDCVQANSFLAQSLQICN